MSCVTQVYDTPNANFQASVSLPEYNEEGNALGGEILGGYDASLNQLIFAYENTCDPAKVTDLTSGWTSPYAVSTSKIGLDDNCAGTSTSSPVLLYDTPSSYDLFNITQMAIFNDPSGGESIIVCGGWCVFKFTNDDGRHGFIFSFYLATGKPYTVLDGGISNGTAPDGWFIKEDIITVNNITINYPSVINCIYTHNDTIIYGGWKDGTPTTYTNLVRQRPLLEKIVISSSGIVTTTPLLSNEFTGYNAPDTEVTVVDITPSIIGILDNCLVIYQTVTQSLIISTKKEIHIRELQFTSNIGLIKWYSNDFNLGGDNPPNGMTQNHTPIWKYPILQYTSCCLDTDNKLIYIAATGTSDELELGPNGIQIVGHKNNPIIWCIGYNPIVDETFELMTSFALNNYPPGCHVYRDHPAWDGMQIDNISFVKKSAMIPYVSGVPTNSLFVTLSSITVPTNKYISFLAALNDGFTAGTSFIEGTGGKVYFNQPFHAILNAIYNSETANQTIDIVYGPGSFNTNINTIQVELDSKLSGTLNDLQFKLAFCSSKLHLFAFGNYVNSPANGSISSFALLKAISNICLSKGTQILCDQGIINIEKINTRKHTINNKPINHITQSIHTDDYLIKIKKNCLSSNSPSSDIICSGDHKILYENNLIESKNLINKVYGVEKIKNDKRVLYNILMDKHEIIMANNTPVESLHPQNIMALFYNNYNNPQAREFLSDKIGQMNNHNIHVNKINKNKLNGLLVGNKISKKMSLKITK